MFFLLLLLFETGYHCVAHTVFEVRITLLLPPELSLGPQVCTTPSFNVKTNYFEVEFPHAVSFFDFTILFSNCSLTDGGGTSFSLHTQPAYCTLISEVWNIICISPEWAAPTRKLTPTFHSGFPSFEYILLRSAGLKCKDQFSLLPLKESSVSLQVRDDVEWLTAADVQIRCQPCVTAYSRTCPLHYSIQISNPVLWSYAEVH